MRQFLVDELSFLERDNIENFLKRTLKPGSLEGVFWLEVPQDLLAEKQQGHEDCGPFYISVILDAKSLHAEFLIRSSSNMHCSCIAWATPLQRQFILDFMDRLLDEEMIGA
jgi:hypothetical protein